MAVTEPAVSSKIPRAPDAFARLIAFASEE